jgi:hypothetical protein
MQIIVPYAKYLSIPQQVPVPGVMLNKMFQREHVGPLVDKVVDALLLHLKVVAPAPPNHAQHKEAFLPLAVPHQERSVT